MDGGFAVENLADEHPHLHRERGQRQNERRDPDNGAQISGCAFPWRDDDGHRGHRFGRGGIRLLLKLDRCLGQGFRAGRGWRHFGGLFFDFGLKRGGSHRRDRSRRRGSREFHCRRIGTSRPGRNRRRGHRGWRDDRRLGCHWRNGCRWRLRKRRRCRRHRRNDRSRGGWRLGNRGNRRWLRSSRNSRHRTRRLQPRRHGRRRRNSRGFTRHRNGSRREVDHCRFPRTGSDGGAITSRGENDSYSFLLGFGHILFGVG